MLEIWVHFSNFEQNEIQVTPNNRLDFGSDLTLSKNIVKIQVKSKWHQIDFISDSNSI